MRFSPQALALAAFAAFLLGAAAGNFASPAGQASATGLFALPALGAGGHCLNGSVEAIISPPSEGEMVGAVSSASRTLDIMLFQFSSSVMKEAVVAALSRGARVRVLLEPRVDSNYETAQFLLSKGAEVRWASTEFAYTHAKLAVIDGRRVLVGSINWSRNALENNREAEVLVDDPAVAAEFLSVFEGDWQRGTPAK